MRILTIALAVSCLGSFAWARRSFFVKIAETRRNRRGLRPLGTLFGVGVVLSLAWNFAGRTSATEIAGAIAMAWSLLLFWSAVRAFGEKPPMIAFTDREPGQLVTNGPYRWIRHPFYAAYELFWIGAFIAEPGVISGVAMLAMGVLYLKAAREEEAQILESAIAESYRKYQRKAGMFLPRVIRLSSTPRP